MSGVWSPASATGTPYRASAGANQGKRRHLHGTKVGSNLLGEGRVDEPDGSLAERHSQQGPKARRRRQLSVAMMDYERHAATALVGLDQVWNNGRPGLDLESGTPEV